MKQRNFVAKYCRQFNKAVTMANKKRLAKNGQTKYKQQYSTNF